MAQEKVAHQEFDWTGYSDDSYNPDCPEMSKSFGQPVEPVSLDDVKRGYKPGG